jgi:hypothetical protein
MFRGAKKKNYSTYEEQVSATNSPREKIINGGSDVGIGRQRFLKWLL